jgi:Leucine-rich repeat (LRR) protein
LLQATCVGLIATHASCTITELPPLAQLRVLQVVGVDDLAAVLTQGTNLRWLQVGTAETCDPSPYVRHDHAVTKLQVLKFWACHELGEDLLQLICSMDAPQLRWLQLWFWPYAELPHTLFQAQALLHLDLSDSSSLEQLPRELGNLVNLRRLKLDGCSGLKDLPDSTTDLRRLIVLSLKKCSNLKLLPKSLGKMQCLEHLILPGCRSLQALPDSITQLQLLWDVDLSQCSSLCCLPAGFGNLPLQYFVCKDLKMDIPPDWLANWTSSGKCGRGFLGSAVHMPGGVVYSFFFMV